MCGSSPAPVAPTPPPRVAEAPRAPDVTNRVGDAAARRRRSAGSRSTILTGPRGVTDGAATAQKTLLGQ